jgi:hypothetical protein
MKQGTDDGSTECLGGRDGSCKLGACARIDDALGDTGDESCALAQAGVVSGWTTAQVSVRYARGSAIWWKTSVIDP